MSNNQIQCPVCGASTSARREGSLDCSVCGTAFAFAEFFADSGSYAAWNNSIKAAWDRRRRQQGDRLRTGGRLIVGPEYLAFHDTNSGELTVIDRFGNTSSVRNVMEYSVSNLHQVTLKTSGIVSLGGEAEGGQHLANGASGIRSVLAAPRCTHLVDERGTVRSYGACSFRDTLAGWKDIRLLACGNTHLAGLTDHGTVVQADNFQTGRSSQETAEWTNIKTIAAAAGYTLGLDRDGNVFYAGSDERMRQEISQWRDVAAIAADSQYAVGLTRDGSVLMAGACKPYLDGGRIAARQWKNVACIGAGHGVIAAVTNDGQLLLAGRFLRAGDVIEAFRRSNPAKL